MKKILTTIILACLCVVPSYANKPVPPKKKVVPFVAKVVANRLNVRTGSSTDFRIVSGLHAGNVIIVYEVTDDGWYKIAYPQNKPLYIFKKYVALNGDGRFGFITGDNVNARDLKTNSRRSRPICQLKRNTQVEIIKLEQEWVAIMPPENAYAWTSGQFTEYIQPYKTFVKKQEDEIAKKTTLAEADELYKKEITLGAERAQMEEVIELYKKALAISSTDEEKKIIQLKIDLALHNKKIGAQLRSARDERLAFEQRMETLQTKHLSEMNTLRAAKMEKKKAVPVYIALGWVESVGVFLNRPSRFRLVKGGRALYYLRSSIYDLDQFAGNFVGIKGIVERGEKDNIKVIAITGIDILHEGSTYLVDMDNSN